MSVHQLPNQLWIFWAKLWIFWASHLHTYKLLSVRKETLASCGLVFEVFVYDSIVLLKAFCSKFRPSSLRYRGPALRRSRLERWRENSKPHARITRPRTGKTHVLSKEVRVSVMALCFFFSHVVSVGRRSLTALGKEWVHAKTGTPYFPGHKAIVTYRDTRQGEDSRDLGRDREVICEILLHLVYWRRFAIDCLFSSRVDPRESQPSTELERIILIYILAKRKPMNNYQSPVRGCTHVHVLYHTSFDFSFIVL